MPPRRGALLGGLVTILLLAPGVVRAQQSAADLFGRPATPEGQACSAGIAISFSAGLSGWRKPLP